MKRLLLLLLAGAGLWLAACSSLTSSASTSLSDRLVAPGGVSTLLDTARIADAVASVPNRHGFVTVRAGVPIFWRAFDPGQYGARYPYLAQQHGNGPPPPTGCSPRRPPRRPPPPAGRPTTRPRPASTCSSRPCARS